MMSQREKSQREKSQREKSQREKRVARQLPAAEAISPALQSAPETLAAGPGGRNRSVLFLALACYLGWLLFLLLIALEVIR